MEPQASVTTQAVYVQIEVAVVLCSLCLQTVMEECLQHLVSSHCFGLLHADEHFSSDLGARWARIPGVLFRTSHGADALESALQHMSPGGCELTAL